jgi:hypothetical protein
VSNPLSKPVQAVIDLVRRCYKLNERQERLKEYLDAHPDIAEEAREGFDSIRNGGGRHVARRHRA